MKKCRKKDLLLVSSIAAVLTLIAALLLPGVMQYAADAKEQKDMKWSEEAELSDINKDYYCDLVIPGTDIRFPVVKGEDNLKYLHTSFDGKENKLGSIFMDYRCGGSNKPHTIIYGHDAKDYDGNLLMFGKLRNYLEEDFINEHTEIDLINEKEVKRFQLFAVKVTDTEDEAYDLDFDEEYSFRDFANLMDAPYGTEEILTLSTCLGSEDDMRLLIQGAIISE